MANTAAATVGTTAASGKRVATTTVHFAPLTSSENVLALQNLAIPLNTSKNNTSWTTNAWIAWTEYVLQQGVDPEDAPSALINQMTKKELNRWLPHCHGGLQTRWQPIPPEYTLSIVLWSFKTHPNYSARMEHLYGCRIHRLCLSLDNTTSREAYLNAWERADLPAMPT